MSRFGVRLAALLGAAVAMLMLSLAAAGVANADRRANFCDVTDSWGGPFAGGFPGDQGVVVFDIFNQVPPAPSNDDGSEDFALVTQLANGLGNAGEGDKYHFRFETVLVSSGANARGHGFLFVPADTGVATFVVAGTGMHPIGGSFKFSGGGDVECAAEEAVAAQANAHVDYQNAPDDDPFVNMARCPDGAEPGDETCTEPGD
jgi:hypothetical protein